MKQEDYRACMSKGLKGKKGLSKEERQTLFCVESRLCSGKAQNEEEALELCAKTVPKWAKQAMPKEDEELSCPVRMARVHQTIDAITLGLKTGDVEEMVPACAQILNDVKKCRPSEIGELAEVAVQEVKSLSKRYYLKGESKDAQNKLAALKELL